MARVFAPENITLVMVASHVDDLAVGNIHEELLIQSRHSRRVSITICLDPLAHHTLDFGIGYLPEVCSRNIKHVFLELLDAIIKFRNLHC
jgi:hypothetical protein